MTNNLGYKRLSHEIRTFRQNSATLPGIWIDFQPENIFTICALIVGPEDTPYAHGNYFFRLKFDENSYPHLPPKVSYESRRGDVRFHPNLYCNGKVCLSILGTWKGPQWTSCQNLTTVLLSLQALLIENPLINEPGFENVSDYRSTEYNEILEYETLALTVGSYGEGKHLPEGFDALLPVVKTEFVRRYPLMMELIKSREERRSHPKKLRCVVFNFQSEMNYAGLRARLATLHQQSITL